jgi:dihydroflavonol-4-reductase
MKAFVTGATGFVGAALLRELLVDRIEVRALVRRNADLRNLAGLDITMASGDLRDAASLAPAMEGCAWVFHVAAHYGTNESDADLMYAVNVQGTQNLLAAARSVGVARIVHCSTIGTIGRTSDGSLPNENTPFNLWQSASHYARSKYQGECAALDAAASGLPVVVVNPCAPVGMRDIRPSSSGRRILDVLNGKLPSYLDGGINHIAVDDVARGHILAAQQGRSGQRYILGNRNLLLHDFLDLVEHASGVPAPHRRSAFNPLAFLRRKPSSAGGAKPAALVCDCSKAISELGLPQTSLDMAFYQAVRWFRENGYLEDTQK